MRRRKVVLVVVVGVNFILFSPVRSGHVDDLDARILGVGQLVQAQHIQIANAHPRHLVKK